jgi:hypothetical protein
LCVFRFANKCIAGEKLPVRQSCSPSLHYAHKNGNNENRAKRLILCRVLSKLWGLKGPTGVPRLMALNNIKKSLLNSIQLREPFPERFKLILDLVVGIIIIRGTLLINRSQILKKRNFALIFEIKACLSNSYLGEVLDGNAL